MSRRRCLFTVVTPRFLPGALVTLASFLHTNPTFDGDVVVVHWGVPQRLRQLMRTVLRRDIRFEEPPAPLRQRIAAIAPVRPSSRFPAACFYFVAAFQLREYDQVLYCDSDLLFLGSVAELFDAEDELLAAPDRPALAGMCRDAVSFGPVPCAVGRQAVGAGPASPAVLADTFNCGFLVINMKRLETDCYDQLLAQLTPERYCRVRSTDGFLLNSHFAGRQTLISSSYNFLVGNAAEIRAREGLRLEDAKVLHFNNRVKPWLAGEMLNWTARGNPRTKPHPGTFKLWYEAYVDLLAGAHVHGAVLAGRRAKGGV